MQEYQSFEAMPIIDKNTASFSCEPGSIKGLMWLVYMSQIIRLFPPHYLLFELRFLITITKNATFNLGK